MASGSEVHEILSLLFTWDDDPPAFIWVNAEEIIQGKFYQKLEDAVCQLKQL